MHLLLFEGARVTAIETTAAIAPERGGRRLLG
jgi:hypothetical protein